MSECKCGGNCGADKPQPKLGEMDISRYEKEQLESALRYLADGGTIERACGLYGEKTNSTSAIVALLKVRELIQAIMERG